VANANGRGEGIESRGTTWVVRRNESESCVVIFDSLLLVLLPLRENGNEIGEADKRHETIFMTRWTKGESPTKARDGLLLVLRPAPMLVESGDCISELGESHGVIRVMGGMQLEGLTVVRDSLLQIN
jgi:hypothetical protein